MHSHRKVDQSLDELKEFQCFMIQTAEECEKMGKDHLKLLNKYHRLKKKYRKLYYSPDPGPGYLKAMKRFEENAGQKKKK